MIFLNTPGHGIPSTLVFGFFSGIAQWMIPIASSYQWKTTLQTVKDLTYSLKNSASWLPDSYTESNKRKNITINSS